MSEPLSDIILVSDQPSIETNNLDFSILNNELIDSSDWVKINNSICTETSESSNLSSTVIKTSGSLAWYAANSSLGRKAIFTSAMYLAGGTIISTIGLTPVLIAGAVVWIL